MVMNNERIAELIYKRLSNASLNESEMIELQHWADAAEENAAYLNSADADREVFLEKLGTMLSFNQEAGWQQFREQNFSSGKAPVKRISVFWKAAAVFVLLAGAAWLFLQKETRDNNSVPDEIAVVNDVAPGMDGAVLTLANGQRMVLDSMPDGNINAPGATGIRLQDGTISYAGNGGNNPSINTLQTPRGRQFHLVLPDGTGAWLNAASSISFPTAFTGNERKVRITGEVYFEVAANKAKPFLVEWAEAKVEVLGTHFNINAYADEPEAITTLVEGKIKMMRGKETVLLKPGQQAVLPMNGTLRLQQGDPEHALAWKNGNFHFAGRTGLEEVMRQVARWYDVEVVYENGVPQQVFAGEMERQLTLKQVVNALNQIGVKVRMDGKKLVVRK